MKQLLLLVSLFVSVSTLKAQSADESIEWMNVKKDEMYMGEVHSNTVAKYSGNNTLEITTEYIKVSNDKGAYTKGNWSSVKEVKPSSSITEMQIIFNFTYENMTSYIKLSFKSKETRDKFIKAAKHMATLKGAKMIDSDLF